MPCSILSVDVQDIMGSHIVNVQGTLYKNRVGKNGKILGKEMVDLQKMLHDHDHDGDSNKAFEIAKKQILEEEGCNLYGDVEVKKVPGNIHLSSHAFGQIVSRLASEGLYKFDLSHKIAHFSFGDDKDVNSVINNFNLNHLNVLEGIEKDNYDKKVFEYYLKVFINFLILDCSFNFYRFKSESLLCSSIYI